MISSGRRRAPARHAEGWHCVQEGLGVEGLAGVTRALTPTLILTLTLPLPLTLTLSLSLTWLDERLTRGLALQGDHEARRGDIQRTGARVGGARRGGCVRVGLGLGLGFGFGFGVGSDGCVRGGELGEGEGEGEG